MLNKAFFIFNKALIKLLSNVMLKAVKMKIFFFLCVCEGGVLKLIVITCDK